MLELFNSFAGDGGMKRSKTLEIQKAIRTLATTGNQEKVFKHFHLSCIMRWIVADPEICHGKPIFRGTRILVSDVLELLAAGESLKTIMEEYPSLDEDMIKEALEYSARVIGGEHHVRFEVPVG